MGELFSKVVDSIIGGVAAIFYFFYEAVLSGMASLLSVIPVPSWAVDVSSLFAQIPASVWYFMEFSQIPIGAGIIFSAYGIRFLIRRIPFIG